MSCDTAGLDPDHRVRRLAGMLARKGYPPGAALPVSATLQATSTAFSALRPQATRGQR